MEFVGRESWPIQCCAQNVETEFMAVVQKQIELPLGWAMHFVCLKCKEIMVEMVDSIEKLCDEVETMIGFCYLGDRLNSSGGCEAAVTARVGIGWVRFRKCEELLLGNRFSHEDEKKVYRCCVRSAILYENEAWCLKENKKNSF